jgi:hypothetical protein
MQQMFATTNNQNAFDLGFGVQPNSFATNIQNVQNKPFSLEGFTLDSSVKKPLNPITAVQPVNTSISSQGF